MKGILVDFQGFISNKYMRNNTEPLSTYTKQSLSEDENIISQLYGYFWVHFVKISAQKHPYMKQHISLS